MAYHRLRESGLLLSSILKSSQNRSVIHILEDFENTSPYFALFLQTVYAIEKLLAGFNWYESVVNLTSLSRDPADDATWVHTAFSTFLHS